MDTKPTKNTEPKAQAIPDLPPAPHQADDVKGGGTITDASATGKIIPKVEIHLF
jgi:hypothetical protein